MKKVTGIKSVDFKITAEGHGAVNWNGSVTVKTEKDGKLSTRNNHNIPKLRGYTSINGLFDDGNPKYKWPEEIDFNKTPLYISQNCLRHHLFREHSVDLKNSEVVKDMSQLLCSIPGILRGYVIAVSGAEYKRTSPLLLTDFVEQNKKGNFEQFSTVGSKEKKGDKGNTTIYSKITFGDTSYVGYGSLSIEQLQFISLDDTFSRKAMNIDNHKDGEALAERLTKAISELGENVNAKATYYKNCVRQGTLYNYGEAGIILNDDAIDVMVSTMIELLEGLSIRQAKSYMHVVDVVLDFNDSKKAKDMMRIKTAISETNPEKDDLRYAEYFIGE